MTSSFEDSHYSKECESHSSLMHHKHFECTTCDDPIMIRKILDWTEECPSFSSHDRTFYVLDIFDPIISRRTNRYSRIVFKPLVSQPKISEILTGIDHHAIAADLFFFPTIIVSYLADVQLRDLCMSSPSRFCRMLLMCDICASLKRPD